MTMRAEPLAPSVVWTPEHIVDLMERSPTHWPRYELVDGELLVTPAPTPRHQRIIMWLWRALDGYLRKHPGVGALYLSPADIRLESGSVIQPDIFVVPPTVRPKFSSWREVPSLVLASEVISPGSERHDRGRKREYFQRMRIPEYWVVDPFDRLVERWRPGERSPERLADRLVWHPVESVEPLVLDLRDMFDEGGEE